MRSGIGARQKMTKHSVCMKSVQMLTLPHLRVRCSSAIIKHWIGRARIEECLDELPTICSCDSNSSIVIDAYWERCSAVCLCGAWRRLHRGGSRTGLCNAGGTG